MASSTYYVDYCCFGKPIPVIRWDGTEKCIRAVKDQADLYAQGYRAAYEENLARAAGRYTPDKRNCWIFEEPLVYQDKGVWKFRGELRTSTLKVGDYIVFSPCNTEYETFGVLSEKELVQDYTRLTP